MARDADAEILELEKQGIVLDGATEDAYRTILAQENAAEPVLVKTTLALSKSTVKRVAAQKKSPRKRRS